MHLLLGINVVVMYAFASWHKAANIFLNNANGAKRKKAAQKSKKATTRLMLFFWHTDEYGEGTTTNQLALYMDQTLLYY